MSGPAFYQTGYGRAFFEHQLPELLYQLKRLADALEAQNGHAAAIASEREACARTVETLYRIEPDGIDSGYSDSYAIATRVRERAAAAIRNRKETAS